MELEPLKELTLKNLLRRSVETFAPLPALSHVNETPITFEEVDARVQKISQQLRTHGIAAGDRVAILSENTPHWGISFFAITTMGAVAVPILPEFHPNEIHHILRHSESKAIFVSERLYPKIEDGQFETLITTIIIDDFHILSAPSMKTDKLREVVKGGGKEIARLKDAALRKTKKLPADVNHSDIASILYSAGTTGSLVQQQVQALLKLFEKHGLGPDDRIAIFSDHALKWGVALFAVQALKATPIPLFPDFQTEELLHIFRHAQCQAVCISESLYEKLKPETMSPCPLLLSLDQFQEISGGRSKEKLGELLNRFSVELDNLRERFPRIPPESVEDQLKELIQKGTQELEKTKGTFSFEPLKEKLREFLQQGSRELENLKREWPSISSEAARDTLRDLLQRGSKDLEKLKITALRMTGKPQVEVREDDLASIIYTSGTTGKSKGVMLTHKNLVSNAMAAAELVSYIKKGGERFLSILPLSHTYECTIGFIIPFMWGACVYYIDKPPTARVLLPAMQKIRPTMMLSVPLVIEKIFKMRVLPQLTQNALMRKLYGIRLIRKKLHRLAGKKLYQMLGGKLHFFGIGGAPLAPDVEAFLRDANFPYAIGYGLTETAPLIAGTNAQCTKYRSTGPAIKGLDLKIAHPNPETGEGEILVRGPNVMKGYYKAPTVTSDVLTEDGWFHTGDLGVLDQDNYLFIKGRLKNMILGPSGENIYPEEIEAIFYEYEYVSEVIVYKQQAHLVARVYLDYDKLDIELNNQNLSETQVHHKIRDLLEELRKNVNARVSSFSRIHKVLEQTEPFEKTPTKKIKRYLYVNEE